MSNLSKLSAAERLIALIVSLIAVLSFGSVIYSHFATDSELAMVQRMSVQRAAKSDSDRHSREIARLQRDIAGGKYSDDNEKQFILREIDRLHRLKDALDE